MSAKDAGEIKKTVRELYAGIARQHTGCCGSQAEEATSCCSSCCGESAHAQMLYSAEELESVAMDIPSLGCGNPIAISGLQDDETVLDLGSGGGLDCFLAAKQVGHSGRVIGLDMTPDMLTLARANAEKLGVDNVEFRLGEMEHMPVEDGAVDVVISNCVINLSPDKDAVFGEIFRVLKPGGRLCVSDIVTRGELPPSVKDDLMQWAGCVAGALEEDEYLAKIGSAGFIELESQEVALDPHKERVARESDAPIASITVTAYKPS